jgi:hypothetical protein
MFFRKDVAQLHTANEILDLLHKHFSDHVSLNCFCQHFGYRWSRPPYSPDFNPCGYFLWRYLKDNGYRNNPQIFHEMKEETEAAVIGIIPDNLGRVATNFQHGLQMMTCQWFTY